MPKTVQVFADLTLENSQGAIRINNSKEGNLYINFPHKKSFFDLLKIQQPSRIGWKNLIRLNRHFYKHRQIVGVKVNNRSWITLGRSSLPQVNFLSVAPGYVSHTSNVKNILYAVGTGLSVTAIYLLFRKRS